MNLGEKIDQFVENLSEKDLKEFSQIDWFHAYLGCKVGVQMEQVEMDRRHREYAVSLENTIRDLQKKIKKLEKN